MRRRALVWLLVCSLIMLGGANLAAAQGTRLTAVTLTATPLYDAPDDSGEPLLEIAANSLLTVLRTDESGAWLLVDAGRTQGYVAAEQVVVLTPAPLAPLAAITSTQAGAPIFARPSMAAELIGAAEYGDMARILGQSEEWAYIVTADGHTGWSITSAWDAIDDLQPALVHLGATDAVGVFAEPNITAELVGTLGEGDLVYLTGTQESVFAEVMTADGTTGWVDPAYLQPVPNTYVDAAAGTQSKPALYAAPDFSAEIVAMLEPGTTLTYLGSPDEFWIEVYSPAYGRVYGLASSFGPVYTTATVRVAGANVRQGPDADLYNAIAQLSAGTEVVVVGRNEAGDWVKVVLPLDEIDYPYRGVEGWMAAFLFTDASGASDLNLDVLSVVE